MIVQCVPYEFIVRAVNGDTWAILVVLKHFEPYITRLSMRPKLGEDGMIHLFPDEDIKQELKIELITKLPQFDTVNG